MNLGSLMPTTGHIWRGAGQESMEESMPFARINMISLSVALVVSVLALGMLLYSPADAQQRNRQQRAYGGQSYSGVSTARDLAKQLNGSVPALNECTRF
jgi:hypothetical protein